MRKRVGKCVKGNIWLEMNLLAKAVKELTKIKGFFSRFILLLTFYERKIASSPNIRVSFT